MRLFIAVLLVSAAVCSAAAENWPGFRGLEKDGRGDATSGPLEWSPSKNVHWKSTIPGRGHSSPIISGDRVYVTTAYELAISSPVQTVAKYALFMLSVLSAVTGSRCIMRNLYHGGSISCGFWQHIRCLLFTQFLSGLVLTVLFGRRLLNPDEDAIRYWAMSVMVALLCLMLTSLCTSLKSRRQLVLSVLAPMITLGAFLGLPDKGLLFALGSSRGLIVTAVFSLPAVYGVALLLAHSISRWQASLDSRSEETGTEAHVVIWHYIVTGAVGSLSALVPFFLLLYRAAGYQMPDRYIWNDRVQPEVSWLLIALGSALVIAASGWSYWKSVHHSPMRRRSLQPIFVGVLLFLGVSFIVHVRLSLKPREFTRALICLSRDNGQALWTCEGLTGRARARGRTVTHASATPVADGERIYAYFGGDGLMCISATGQLLWKKPEPMFASKFGVGTSPVAKDNVLILVSDVRESDELMSSITAYDGMSGEILWRKRRRSHEVYAGYSTPLIKSLAGNDVVIVHGWYDIKGYDCKTGKELWSYPVRHEGKHLVASPVCDEDQLYAIGAKQIRAFEFTKLGTESAPLAWSTPVPGEKSSTPVVVNGLLFLVTETGIAVCLDAETGAIQWKQRLKGRYYSSVIAAGDRVLLTNEAGRTTVVAADRQYRELAVNSLDGSVYASLAALENQLFVRTTEYLYSVANAAP